MDIVTPHRSDIITFLVFLAACVLLLCLNLYPKGDSESGAKTKVRVLTVEDVPHTNGGGLVFIQSLQVQVLNGPFKGKKFPATNEVRPLIEISKMIKPGDIALVSIHHDAEPEVSMLIVQGRQRLDWFLMFFGFYVVLFFVFASVIGAKALMPFILSCLCVWKLLVPLSVKGFPPQLVCIACACILTAAIMYLTTGASRKGFAVFAGIMLSVLLGCLLSVLFTHIFHTQKAIRQYYRVLFYAEHTNIDARLFVSAFILASSGAAICLGMYVADAMEELVMDRPDISRRELIASGWKISQSILDTIIKTLLLAYAGGYLTLTLAYVTLGTHPMDFVKNPAGLSEAVKGLALSFFLFFAAPITALVGGLIFVKKKS